MPDAAPTLRIPTDYDEWSAMHGVHHGHCPLDCEHPQPFVLDGKAYCGYCWHRRGLMTEIDPCPCREARPRA